MNTTPAKKHSRCRKRLFASPSKRKALHRRGLRAFRCWQHLTRCFSAFQSRKLSAFSMFRTLRQTFGAAVLALLLPAIAKADNFVVTTNSDTTDGGDGELTLREAITLANNSAGPDTVGFAQGLSGDVLILTQGELVISDDLSIDASSLAEAPIIDADQNSRVIDFTVEVGDLELTNLTLRNGMVTGESAKGGGILSSGGDLTLTNSIVNGNSASATGHYGSAYGGGISTESGAVTLMDSTLSGNSASATGSGGYAHGGGIRTNSGEILLTNSSVSENFANGEYYSSGGGTKTDSGAVTLMDSTLSGNSANGNSEYSWCEGGAIGTNSGAVMLTNSTLSENSVSGEFANGGGISASGPLTITDSTLNENSVSGEVDGNGGGISANGPLTITDSTLSGNSVSTNIVDFSRYATGGGIASGFDPVTLTNSTLSGNSASGFQAIGGGLQAHNAVVTIVNCTISGNSVSGDNANGGGISSLFGESSLILTNSIIAGNSDDGTAPDVESPADPANDLEVSHCLIGDSTGAGLDEAAVNLNNITDTDPLLGPLADNGGDTKTQLPFPGSPAINAGGGSPPLMDQRGFNRVGLPDIGAVEYQGPSDWNRIFESDHDGDGNSFGIEQALGTDHLVSDASNPRNLTAPSFNPSGHPVLSFGIADDAAPGTLWILERSTNLSGFEEIYRFDGTIQTIGGAFTLDVQTTATGVTITDQDPPTGGAFYRFKTTLPDPG